MGRIIVLMLAFAGMVPTASGQPSDQERYEAARRRLEQKQREVTARAAAARAATRPVSGGRGCS